MRNQETKIDAKPIKDKQRKHCFCYETQNKEEWAERDHSQPLEHNILNKDSIVYSAVITGNNHIAI